MRILVPLIAQLLVRHPEFEERYRARTNAAGAQYDHLTKDDTGWAVNIAREVDRLAISGLLGDSQWWLITSSQPLVGSDLGLGAAGGAFDGVNQLGYVFPLSSNIAIYVGNGTANFNVENDAMYLNVRDLTALETVRTNEVLAAWAPTTVFGHSRREVERAIRIWSTRTSDPALRQEIPHLLHSGRTQPPHVQAEFWLRTVHRAQRLDEPDNRNLVPFDDCDSCAARLHEMTIWEHNFRTMRSNN